MASVHRLLIKPVLWESVALSLICLADAFWTVLMVRAGVAKEANPMVGFFLDHSVAAFIGFKVISFLPGIVAAEYLRFSNERFARVAIRLGLVAYLVLYIIGDLHLNHVI